jgi:F-type H+-transporting ATPase subunit b
LSRSIQTHSTSRARFSGRFLGVALRGLAFLAVLMAAGVVATFPAMAQKPASATPAQTAAQPDGQSTPQAAMPESDEPDSSKEDPDNPDQFRHSPMVVAAARVFHLSVEATARIFEGINFAIIALAVGIPLFRFLPNFLRKRAEKIRTDIDSARKMTEDANSRLSAIEAKLSGLGEEIAKFRAEVERESVQDEARIKAALADESARIVSAAEQEIGVAAAQARRGLRHFAAELAIEQAGKQLVLTPEIDSALIAEFVSGVSGKGAARGGRN